jgi:four helix bundle protein
MQTKKFDLEDRLVEYTCRMMDVVEALPATRSGNYIAAELIRSGYLPTISYGQAQHAASPKDFVQKMSIVLKELKECRTALKVILKKEIIQPAAQLDGVYKETDELIAITAKSIVTSKKNNNLR